MRYLIFAIPLLLLAACATLSADECRAGNWEAIGRSDGADGRREDFILQHAKACNEHGILPNKTEWIRGRADGLLLYCTPFRAYDEGRRGRRLSPVCPAEELAMLGRANDRGLRRYEIEQEIRATEREITAIQSQIATLPSDDPSRASLVSEIGHLRLDLLSLRAARARYL